MATISNICNYNPIVSLSLKEINGKFSSIHRYLCYLGSGASGASIQPGSIDIGGNPAMRYGTVSFNGDGVQDTLIIPHTLGSTPTAYIVFNDSGLTTNFLNRNITPDDTNLTVVFSNPPGPGEDATFSWLVLL